MDETGNMSPETSETVATGQTDGVPAGAAPAASAPGRAGPVSILFGALLMLTGMAAIAVMIAYGVTHMDKIREKLGLTEGYSSSEFGFAIIGVLVLVLICACVIYGGRGLMMPPPPRHDPDEYREETLQHFLGNVVITVGMLIASVGGGGMLLVAAVALASIYDGQANAENALDILKTLGGLLFSLLVGLGCVFGGRRIKGWG